jgi:hypothetical protein
MEYNSFFQAAFPLIDRILESINPTENLNLTTFVDLVGANDCIAFPESNQAQVEKFKLNNKTQSSPWTQY